MAAVEAIGDEALGSALNVSVTSEPVMIVNQTYNVSETAGSCSPGYYCPVGATSPLPCPGGTRSDPSMPYMTLESDCIACKQGTACSLGSSQETNCSAGTYNDAVRQVQCVTCPSGKYQNEAGATVCLDCPVTRFCPEGTATPIACPPGTINTETGASSPDMCLDCPSGYWCTGGDRVPCTKDTYNPVVSTASTDQSACLSCPDDSTTDGQQNASSVASCLCKVDFYDAAEEPDAVDCEACPSGSDCSAVGNTLVTLPVKRGYYRIDDTDDDVRRCPDAAINCTAASECAESTSGCHGTVEPRRSSPASGFFSANTSLNCYEDLTGVFCRLCRDRADGKHVYYRSATRIARAQCVECREVARDTILSFFGLSVLAILFVLLLVYVYDAYVSERRKRLVRYAWWRFKPHNKIKILIGFYQVATKIGYVYEVELPPAVVQLLSYIATGVSLGFSITDRLLQCLGMRGYFAKLSLYMAFPFALSFLILLGALVRMVTSNQCNRDTLVDICVPPMLRLGFLAYPLVTTLAFDAFTCYHFTKSEWLRADVAIQCDTSQHSEAKALAWVAICLYPVGLFVINAALLYAARKAIVSKRPTTLSKAISFLHAEYDLTLFWWELVELFRRFVLVGVMVLGQGSMMQLVIGTLLAAVFLLFQVQASPYADISDSFLASVASFALVAVFLCATAFKYIALTDLGDIRAKMSREQRELYQVNAAILTVIVFASVFAALVFSCVLFLVQLRFEDARIRKEARTSKARRLRYKDGQHEVHAPPIEERGFHALLSHVWGTGQDQMRVVKQRLLEMIPELQLYLDVDEAVVEEAGALDGYIDRTSTVLVYATRGYFTSRSCMLELVSSAAKKKPLIALVDPDARRGGLSCEQVLDGLIEADRLYEKWGFETDAPRGKELHDHLFAHEQVEWNRIGHFQSVTMRLIAERLLPDAAGTTYVDGELISQQFQPLPPPRDKHTHHIYCSEHNPGASALMTELAHQRGLASLGVTTRADQLTECDHVLLYLTAQTWTRGRPSAALAEEITKALVLGVHVLLVHEIPGVGGQAERGACEFSTFFSCPDGATPAQLLKLGVYLESAVPLKGGAWRSTSMALLGLALGCRPWSEEDLWHLTKEGEAALFLKAKRVAYAIVGGVKKTNNLARTSVAAGRLSVRRRSSVSARPSMPESVDLERSCAAAERSGDLSGSGPISRKTYGVAYALASALRQTTAEEEPPEEIEVSLSGSSDCEESELAHYARVL